MNFQLLSWCESDNSKNEADVYIKNGIDRFLLECSPDEFIDRARLVLNIETLFAATPSYLYLLYMLAKFKIPDLSPITPEEAQYGLHDYLAKLIFPLLCKERIEAMKEGSGNSISSDRSRQDID